MPQFQDRGAKDSDARKHLNALEFLIVEKAIKESKFSAILNEKDPLPAAFVVTLPSSFRAQIVSEHVKKLRSHPDFRTARRAMITSRLAQVISEREVKGGLRRVLVTQTKRLQWLAERRFEALGGAKIVEKANEDAAGD